MYEQEHPQSRRRHRGFGRGDYGPGEGGRRGFGPGDFGPGFGPGDFGPGFGPRGPRGPMGPGGPRGRGRRRRGDVRLALLMLLKIDGARNGYQLMQGLEERSDGRWRPSPGSVYPALSQLEDEGLIHSVAAEGESGRSFELTDAGREYLDARADQQAPWEPQGAADDARAELRNAVIATIKAARQVGQDGDAEQLAKVTELFTQVRRDIYRVLAGDAD